jgi:hypothetical protein
MIEYQHKKSRRDAISIAKQHTELLTERRRRDIVILLHVIYFVSLTLSVFPATPAPDKYGHDTPSTLSQEGRVPSSRTLDGFAGFSGWGKVHALSRLSGQIPSVAIH